MKHHKGFLPVIGPIVILILMGTGLALPQPLILTITRNRGRKILETKMYREVS